MDWLNEWAKIEVIWSYIGFALFAICIAMLIIYAIACGIESLSEYIEKKKIEKEKEKEKNEKEN